MVFKNRSLPQNKVTVLSASLPSFETLLCGVAPRRCNEASPDPAKGEEASKKPAHNDTP
jgi:hypothetical protein